MFKRFYVMSSNNSCCGVTMNDFVDYKPLENVLAWAVVVDFDIYSENGKAIVAAGKVIWKIINML